MFSFPPEAHLSVSLTDRASEALEVQGDKGAKMVPEPADAKVLTSTAVEWDSTLREMKREALGDQTVTSHKALFTEDTHTHPASQQRFCSTNARHSPSFRAGTWETALIPP